MFKNSKAHVQLHKNTLFHSKEESDKKKPFHPRIRTQTAGMKNAERTNTTKVGLHITTKKAK